MCGKKGIISSERRCTCGYVFGTNPDDKFRLPGQDEEIVTVADADNPDELIENWRCDFCGAYNKSSERKCKTCGHPRDESAKGYYSVTGERRVPSAAKYRTAISMRAPKTYMRICRNHPLR